MLISSGLVTSSALAEAEARQAAAGGHLDTVLLELGLVDEGKLLDLVGSISGFPVATADDLRRISDETLALVPAKLARRARAVPFASTPTTVSVALLDPRNLAVHDELGFVSGRRVTVHVALEARIAEALEKYYDEPMPARFGSLVDRMNRARFMWRHDATPGSIEARATEPRAAATPHERASHSSPPLRPTTPPTPHPSPTPAAAIASWNPPPLPLPQTRSGAGSHTAELDLQAFEARLAVLGDREQIGNYVLAFLRRVFPRVLLFVVRRDTITGWLGSGSGVDMTALDTFELPLDQPSLFASLAKEGNFHVGPLPPLPAHRQLAALWGGQLPRRCLLLPVRIKERLVTVIYCEIDDSTPPVDVYALQRLAAATSQAFEFCIVRRKMDQASG